MASERDNVEAAKRIFKLTSGRVGQVASMLELMQSFDGNLDSQLSSTESWLNERGMPKKEPEKWFQNNVTQIEAQIALRTNGGKLFDPETDL